MEKRESSELIVRCLQLPLQGMSLLVPNTCVAEITDYEPPVPTPHAPAWMRGMLMWRGSSVPLISFEQLMGDESPTGRGSQGRIAVFNSFSGNRSLPFFAMELQGIPHIMNLGAEDLEQRELKHADLATVQCRVVVDGEESIIPDIDIIEGMLLQLGLGRE